MVLLLLLFTLFSSQPVLAQESASPSAFISPVETPTLTPSPTLIPTSTPTPNPNISLFTQYSQDYKNQLFIYQQDYLSYSEKINVHTQYGTITTLQDKIDASKKVLISRNNLLRHYLTALRVKLKIYQDQDPTTSQSIGIEINKWEDWLNEQNSVVASLNNMDDIKSFSMSFNSRYIYIQQALYTGLVQDEINLRLHTLSLIKNLKEDIRNDNQIKPESQEWLSSITVKADLVNSNLRDAYQLTQVDLSSNQFTDFYPSAKNKLGKANTYLLEMRNNLQSIVTKFYNH